MQMSQSTAALIQAMQAHARLATSEDVAAFDAALDPCGELVKDLSLAEIKDLLRVFRDDAIHQEAMWGLIHLVDATPIETFLSAFLSVLPEQEARAGDWMLWILVRVTNNPESSMALVRHASGAEAREYGALMRILVRASSEGSEEKRQRNVDVIQKIKRTE